MKNIRRIFYIAAFVILSILLIVLYLWLLNDKDPFSMRNIIIGVTLFAVGIPMIMLIKRIFTGKW
jgi:hypothetical protein